MKAEERRSRLLEMLKEESKPLSGSTLADALGISRQSVVQDIAVLKADGHDIISTNRGYLLKVNTLIERVFKVRHSSEQTEDELTRIVALGGRIVDVFVWHRVYGRIVAPLNINTRRDVEAFMDGIKSGKSTELMHITAGYHYHTVRADSIDCLDRIGEMLRERGYEAPGM